MKRTYIKPETMSVIVNVESLMESASSIILVDEDYIMDNDLQVGVKFETLWDDDEY